MSETLSVDSGAPLSSVTYDDIVESLFTQYSELHGSQQPEPTGTSFFPSLRSLPILNKILPQVDDKTQLINKLLAEQKTASTYKKWYDISLKLDELMNNNSWKSNPQSDLYDYDLIFNNLNEMRSARLSKDYKLLLYYIRTKWIRNLGNMGDINLYRHSFVGTKKLIEEYIDECQLSLNFLINDENVNLDDRYLLGMLIQTRKNIGRTALVLSGGSTFGFFHIGVLATLFESGLLPRIISGSSAGSVVASILCCHTNDETYVLLSTITQKKFVFFGDSKSPHEIQGNFKKVLERLSHLLKYGTLFDMTGLQQTMIDFLGDLTFREAYNRTGKILNITVSPASIHESTRLLNYLTAPNCLIWSAVCASCSLPGVFSSTTIYEKNPRTNEIHEWNNDLAMKYVDGSVDNDLPITRLSEMFNVDHIIAVQVNPHVVPVLKVAVSNVGGNVENELSYKFKHFLNNVYDFVSCEIVHYLQILNTMDIYKNLSNKLISVLSQKYSGDITILPDFKIQDFTKIFKNPTPEFLLDFIIRGAKASWPKVTVIHNHCSVEFALDKAINILRGRLITSAYHLPSNSSSTSANRTALKNSEKPEFLVNSPVLNSESSSALNTPERTKLDARASTPAMRRFNSSSSYPSKQQFSTRLKRRSISSQSSIAKEPIKDIKGKSTTSLATLSHDFHTRNASNDSTLINDDLEDIDITQHLASRARTEGSLKPPTVSVEPAEEPKNIRKARSSGNFHNNMPPPYVSSPSSPTKENAKLRYQADRIPYNRNNPYLENSLAPDESLSPTKVPSQDKEKANLPRISRASSVRNSNIGLNRLKDTKLSRSTNNSHYNLKNYANLNSQELLKSLNSPDLRRGLKRNYTRDLFSVDLFNTSDNDEDLIKFDTSGPISPEGDEFLGDDEAGNPVDDDVDNTEDDLAIDVVTNGSSDDVEANDESEVNEDSSNVNDDDEDLDNDEDFDEEDSNKVDNYYGVKDTTSDEQEKSDSELDVEGSSED
ncbi:acyl transferase/acyl hydrolase/lysophospholipase [Scheffersomyces xylosifermentans]|uniref:acyl transferase/acyl hydrolase/lysophospholipase n=1 Tax=Scheffersomyces xylosifermentans TaxID=1304137 RepID=UPI00315C740F